MGLVKLILGANERVKKQKELKEICMKYTYNQKRLISLSRLLFEKRKSANKIMLDIEDELKTINELPTWVNNELSDFRGRMDSFRTAIKYETDPLKFAENTDETGRTSMMMNDASDISGAINTLGPVVSMSIATVIGTISTGTFLGSLSSSAATNAALTWLGGGSKAAGGTDTNPGTIKLGMFGPVGLAVAGLVGGVLFTRITNKKKMIDTQKYIDQIKHDNQNLEPKLSHLSELIQRTKVICNKNMKSILEWLKSVKKKNYNQWNVDDRQELEKIMNTISNCVQLINERI